MQDFTFYFYLLKALNDLYLRDNALVYSVASLTSRSKGPQIARPHEIEITCGLLSIQYSVFIQKTFIETGDQTQSRGSALSKQLFKGTFTI